MFSLEQKAESQGHVGARGAALPLQPPRLGLPCSVCTGVRWGTAKTYEGQRQAFGMPGFNTRVWPEHSLDVAGRAAVRGWDSRASLTGVIKHWPLHWMETKLADSRALTLDLYPTQPGFPG